MTSLCVSVVDKPLMRNSETLVSSYTLIVSTRFSGIDDDYDDQMIPGPSGTVCFLLYFQLYCTLNAYI